MRTRPRSRDAKAWRPLPLVAAFACAFGPSIGLGADFWVTNTNTGGLGSLAEAINQVNTQCATGPHTIRFATSATTPAGPFVVGTPTPINIDSTGPLPSITCAGTHVDGANSVAIQPSLPMYGGVCGLTAAPASGLVKVTGVNLRYFNYLITGIGLCGPVEAVGNLVHDNFNGIDAGPSSLIRGNTVHSHTAGFGVKVQADSLIGGPSAADRNLVYNNYKGIFVDASARIEGNYIGTFDGTTPMGNTYGIYYSGATSNVEIVDNVVSDNDTGIQIYGAATLLVSGNKVGTTASGTTAIGNNWGIQINGADGTYAVSNNVISGNAHTGLSIWDSSGSGSVTGNKIGTDPSGTSALPNSLGLEISFTYGGPLLTIADNVISGNTNGGISAYNVSGVKIGSSAPFGGNRIGTNSAGTAGLANGFSGLSIDCSTGVEISDNTISANGSYGGIQFTNTEGSVIRGNRIGTAADAVSPLGNTGPGVYLENYTNCFQAPNGPLLSPTDLEPKVAKALGPIDANNLLEDNTIAHNQGDGIFVFQGVNNRLVRGSTHSNAAKNINLDFPGAPTPIDADPPDGSGGPNNRQNFPVITSAMEDSGQTVVNFELNSIPAGALINGVPFNGQFKIQAYKNATPGVHAGQTYLSEMIVGTNASGLANGTFTFAGSHTNIALTATGPYGTSEFSASTTPLVPGATILPGAINFGNVIVGATSAPQEVVFTSTGSGAYMIDSMVSGATPPSCPGSGISICTSGDFSCSTNCAALTPYATQQPNAPACKITGITFHPMTTGAQSTNVFVCDNTSATPRVITLSGNGIPLTLTTSAGSVNFGTVPFGTNVTSPVIVITNPASNPPATLSAPVVPPPFVAASGSTCGTSVTTLAPGATCNLIVGYGPTSTSLQSGTASIAVGNGNPVNIAVQGVGAPSYTISPTSRTFAPQALNTPSAPQTFALSNTSSNPIPLGAITATAPFSFSGTTCGGNAIPASGTCNVSVIFTPTANGVVNGTLTVPVALTGAPPMAANLTGTGGISNVVLPASANLGTGVVGGPDLSTTITLLNNGTVPLSISSIAVTAPFQVVHACPASLGAGASCGITIKHTPTVVGNLSGTLSVVSNSPQSPHSVPVSAVVQAYSISPSLRDFGTLALNTTSAPQSFTLFNTSPSPLPLGTMSATPPFAVSGHTCSGSQVPAAGSCDVSVVFTPAVNGLVQGTLTVNVPIAGAPPMTADLRGTGGQSNVVLPASANLGSGIEGGPDLTTTVTLQNSGTLALAISSIFASPPFQSTHSCPASLGPGLSCLITVKHTPSAAGTFTGTLTVASDSPQSPHTVPLSVSVASAQGVITLPTGIDFGTSALAGAVLQQVLLIRNTGNGNVDFTGIAASPPFQSAHNCPARLAPQASCNLTLSFDPLSFGQTTGQLAVNSNAQGGNRIVTLLATVDRVTYGISPATDDYSTLPVGQISTPRTFVVSNNGDRAIPLAGLNTTGPFAITRNDCGSSLPPRGSCNADVTFNPVQPGGAAGTVRARIGLPGAPDASARLSGVGTQQAGLALPDEVDFGAVTLGSVGSVVRTLDIRNTGNAVLTFQASITSGAFVLSGNCPLNLRPGEACVLQLTFTPAAVGEFTGSLAVTSNAPGGSRSIRLVARVQPRPVPVISFTPTVIGFGDRAISPTPSDPQNITITNIGAVEATLGPLTAGPDYVVSSQCGATLAPQARCTAEVRFRPVRFGARPDSVQFSSNATGSPHRIDLLGRGCRPFGLARRPGQDPCSP